MTSRLDPQSLAYRKPTPRDVARIHEADRAAILAPVHRAASADNCTRCDGDGLIPQWPHGLLTPSEIAAGYGEWTDPCPECKGSGLQAEDDE